MITRIMRKLGWVPVADLKAVEQQSDLVRLRMDEWAEDIRVAHEREYRELAERWAETREHLFDRKQLHALQRVVIDYRSVMPPAPVIIAESK